MEPLRDDQLIADLQALRPTPGPQFAAELDERAAAGFPRRSRLRLPSFNRLRALPRRRLLLPAGGVALAAIAIATVVAISGQQSGTSSSNMLSLTSPETHSSEQAPQVSEPSPTAKSESASPAASEASGIEVEAEERLGAGAVGAANGSFLAASGSLNPRHSDVERSAEVVLGAEPENVADDAAKVFEAVHANDGIVMRSSTQQGKAGEAGATFELLIPSTKLPNALAAFSAIDEVRSRHEATADITHPTVTTAELLRESRARIDSLLGQLGEAESESEREAIEVELRHERRHAARLAGQLDHLQRRADYSRVLLRIVTGESQESSGGAWGIDDALHDAGHILAVAAAVTVVGLAILGPIALIVFLAWLTHRAWVRRERRRALG
jgi:uncharacterized protein DUF4349